MEKRPRIQPWPLWAWLEGLRRDATSRSRHGNWLKRRRSSLAFSAVRTVSKTPRRSATPPWKKPSGCLQETWIACEEPTGLRKIRSRRERRCQPEAQHHFVPAIAISARSICHGSQCRPGCPAPNSDRLHDIASSPRLPTYITMDSPDRIGSVAHARPHGPSESRFREGCDGIYPLILPRSIKHLKSIGQHAG